MCQLRTRIEPKRRELIDDLVGARVEEGGDIYTQRLGGPIQHEVERSWLHDRQFIRLGALEDAAGIDASLSIGILDVGSVADETTGDDKVSEGIYRRKLSMRSERNERNDLFSSIP